MSELVDRLKADAEIIRGTALWKRYDREIQAAVDWYSRELRGNSKIGLMLTYGQAWQEQLQRLNKIANLFDTLIADAAKADE
jgi:hypothetical protein